MWWSRVLEEALWMGSGSNLSAARISAISHFEGQDIGFSNL